MRIYLAGLIQGGEYLSKCVEWRKRIREYYNNYKGSVYPITWLDPLNSGELESVSEDGLKSNLPANMIVHKDYLAVQEADIIVVNMDNFGAPRNLTGTLCELAWAWQMRKPIIMISNEDKYIEHPFLKVFASVIVKDVDTMLKEKWIQAFYKCLNSAEY